MPRSPSPRRAVSPSLFRSGIGPRLAYAVTLSALVWLTIGWALSV